MLMEEKMEQEIKVSDVNVKHTTINESAQNSFEFGKAGCRHKVYWKDLDELRQKIRECKDAEGFLASLEAPEEPLLAIDEIMKHDIKLGEKK